MPVIFERTSMLKRVLVGLVTVAAGLAGAIAAPQTASASDVYTTPGDHLVNGRYWNTDCSKYSTTVVRCSTDIWADKVVKVGGSYVMHKGWAFNNLTYLPPSVPSGTTTRSASAPRSGPPPTAGSGRPNATPLPPVGRLPQLRARRCRQAGQRQVRHCVHLAVQQHRPVRHLGQARGDHDPKAAPPLDGVPVETDPVPTQSCKASYYWEASAPPTVSGSTPRR
ncbi:hypothetical protein [Tessaracoccus coleopterorum]|uniref:hypothetical protein n=1 Tax=Tessaracoccus coleopterorum TaxID=2714950 RepID=UPI0018D34228|nr:hypothetical protein [Tessaracoccus coleopterorum]